MRLLREPLLHFLILGAALFGIFAVRGERSARSDRIVVSAGEIDHLSTGFARTWQRPPTTTELDGLIDDYVHEEIYAREAVALGLDRDDTIVRRRLRQKMEFLVEDAARATPPSDEQLQAFMAAHPERVTIEPTFRFRQVYLSPERHGDRLDADARALLARLNAAGPDADVREVGDVLLVPDIDDAMSESDVGKLFGPDFARALHDLPLGGWGGPVTSAFGAHLVLLRERVDGRLQTLDEAREAVTRDLLADEHKRLVDDAFAQLRARYQVVIERPSSDAVAAR